MSELTPIIYVVDDDASVRKSVKRLITSMDFHVETFTSAQEFLRFDRSDRPCCLILDIRMPGISGLALQEELTVANYTIPIIFITGHGDISMSVRAMKKGAVDFLTKPFDDQDLLDAIHKAIEQDKSTRQEQSEISEIQKCVDSLTSREREVFALVVTGMLNKQIAYTFKISEKTVKVHRARAMQKMHAKSLAHLVRMADKLGIEK